MEAVFSTNSFSDNLPLREVLPLFFVDKSPQTVNLFLWRLYQCWVTKECTLKKKMSDEEVAALLDQLDMLVHAAYKEFCDDSPAAAASEKGEQDD